MNMENKIIQTILIIVIILFFIWLSYVFIKHEIKDYKEHNQQVKIIDTTYNHIVLDSIEYNIIIKDSVITHIRHEYEDSIVKVISFDDSTSFELFKRLVSE